MKKILYLIITLLALCACEKQDADNPVYDTLWTCMAISTDGNTWISTEKLPSNYDCTLMLQSKNHICYSTGLLGNYQGRFKVNDGYDLYISGSFYLTMRVISIDGNKMETNITLFDGFTFYIQFYDTRS